MNGVLVLFEIACIFNAITAVSDREKHHNIVGENLCNTTIKYEVESEQEVKFSYRQPVKQFCWKIPFRCTIHKLQERIELKKIVKYHNKTVLDCCEGYQNVSGKCLSLCKDGCVNGKCGTPNNCSCFEGWKGSNCSEECDTGFYGKGCIKHCLCQNGATCDRINGTCNCTSGYTGEYCESVCSGNSNGSKCENVCQCKNGAVCNATDGLCECLPGYFGKHCKRKCFEGLFGKDCKNYCKCKTENTEVCSHITGECLCMSGWRGKTCEKTCEDQTWGPLCKNKCDCGEKSSCHRVTGKCSCVAGWHGSKCEQKCPPGYFEKDCKMKCPDCLHEPGVCHHVSGWCNCPNGTTGPTCDLECPDGKYGKDCSKICLCSGNSTCDPVTGECICEPGWMGPECEFPCTEGTYGDGCNFTCNCSNDFSCNRFNGNCSCDETNDSLLCMHGWLIQDEDISNSTPLLLFCACVFGITGLCILGLIVFCKKKKNPCSEIMRDAYPSSPIFDESTSDGKRFVNPVYEEMNNSILSSPKSVAQVQPVQNNSGSASNLEGDFKIPDCDFVATFPNNSHENSEVGIKFHPEPQASQVNRTSVDLPNVIFSKKVINSPNSEKPVKNSAIYEDVDLKEEHHYEFPTFSSMDITQKD